MKPDPTLAEQVDHPAHYNRGKIEVIDFIEDQQLDFNLGNAIKYICRAGNKESSTREQDLAKAIWYTQRALGKNKKQPRVRKKGVPVKDPATPLEERLARQQQETFPVPADRGVYIPPGG